MGIGRLVVSTARRSLDLPTRFGEPFAQHFLGGFGFLRIYAILRAAIARWPFPNHEPAKPWRALPGAEKSLVQFPLKIHVDRNVRLSVIPRFMGGVLLAA